MGVGSLVSQEAARVWSDPANRQRIVQMHAEGRSLVEMTDALGLGAALDADGLRDVVAGLTPAEVELLRNAFVAEAERTRGRARASPSTARSTMSAAACASRPASRARTRSPRSCASCAADLRRRVLGAPAVA